MTPPLIKEKKYTGRYVAIEDLGKPRIIADGETPQEVYEEAQRKGFNNPIVLFIPHKNQVQIY